MIGGYIQNQLLEPMQIINYKVLVIDKPTLKWLGLEKPEMVYMCISKFHRTIDIRFPLGHVHLVNIIKCSTGEYGISFTFKKKDRELQFFRDRLVAEL